jgi:hypothetical protein
MKIHAQVSEVVATFEPVFSRVLMHPNVSQAPLSEKSGSPLIVLSGFSKCHSSARKPTVTAKVLLVH